MKLFQDHLNEITHVSFSLAKILGLNSVIVLQ